MTTWQRSEPFCKYVRNRRRRRAMWLEQLYAGAQNEHSARLVDRLALRWAGANNASLFVPKTGGLR